MSVVAVYEKNGGGGGSGGVGYDGHAHVVRDEASCIVQQNSGESGSTLKAHDYIGLSEVTSTPHKMENAESKTIPDLNLGETELRLGPPKTFKSSVQGVDNSAADASQQMWPKVNGASSNEGFQMKMRESHDTKVVDINESKDAEARESAADAHKFWQAHIARNMEQVRSMMSNQSQQEIQEMGTYNNAALNASNLKAVSGAKRGFSEALGNGSFEGRSVMPTIAPVVSGNASQNGKSPMIPAMYPWSSSKQLPAAWKMGLEQSKGSFGPFPSSRQQQQQQQQHQQQQQQKNMGDANESNNAWDSSSTSKTSGKGNGGQKQQNKEHDNNEDVAPASSPPVVGWPPVQSFRKNTLASHPPKPSSTPDSTKAAAAPSATAAAPSAIPAASNSAPALPPTANSSVTPLLVKVYMDGVPIGRKVDLKSHNSYEKLSSVLEEMFHRFIINQNGTEAASTKDSSLTQESKKLNFLHGSEFVLTYEDKDGDLMLVGDVPWGMFTGTVRRLRIMKGSEAIGLAAPRAAEKVTMSS